MAVHIYRVHIRILQYENRQTNALSKLANTFLDCKPKRIQWETLLERTVELDKIMWLDRSSTWRDLILVYLTDKTLPSGLKVAK